MADLFSARWMEGFKDAWNRDPELSGALERIGFASAIGYGFKDEPAPRGVIVVENGRAVRAAPYANEPLDWDLRANRETWDAWLAKPPGMLLLGMAYSSSQLQFVLGDYAAMIKDPRMAGPFMKSFAVMGSVA
ncbi:MAG: hypothetical protein NW217_11165 [Hyphomicrobiaceae bacterium]|nr:hypothetical protein [Hyphomicrobiaceae bacterium]